MWFTPCWCLKIDTKIGHIQIDTVHGNESSTSEAMMERCAIDNTANS